MSKVHHHACPNCYGRPLCSQDCTTEIDDDGARRGGTVLRDRCAALTAPPSAEQRLAELREAARAFLDAFANQAARCVLCEEEGKREPVMLREGLRMACDAHGRELLEAPEDFSYAPALRRLRALLAGRQP